jgi:hypothetical protein
MTNNELVWRFLRSQRGQMFCAQCIGKAVLALKRIDSALMRAEARGAIRLYGRCVTCGRDRLLCGLAYGASPAISPGDHTWSNTPASMAGVTRTDV